MKAAMDSHRELKLTIDARLQARTRARSAGPVFWLHLQRNCSQTHLLAHVVSPYLMSRCSDFVLIMPTFKRRAKIFGLCNYAPCQLYIDVSGAPGTTR